MCKTLRCDAAGGASTAQQPPAPLTAAAATATRLETLSLSEGLVHQDTIKALEALAPSLGRRPLLPALRKLILQLEISSYYSYTDKAAVAAKLAAKLVAGQKQQARGGLEILLDVDWSGRVDNEDAASRLLTLASRTAAAPGAPAGCTVNLRDIVLNVYGAGDSSRAHQLWPEAAPLPRCRQLKVTPAGFPGGMTMGDQWAAAEWVVLEMKSGDAITEGCTPPNATMVTCCTGDLPAGVNPLQLPCALKHLELLDGGGSLLGSWLPALAPIAAQLEVLILGKVESSTILVQLLVQVLKKATRLYWLSVCPTTPDLLDVFEAFCCGGGMPTSLQVVQLQGGGNASTRARMASIIQAHLPQALVVGDEMSPDALGHATLMTSERSPQLAAVVW